MSLAIVSPHLNVFESAPAFRGRITLPPIPFSQKATKVHGTVASSSTPQPTSEQKRLVRDKGLIVVSNRLPITIKRHAEGRYQYNKSSGGLVTGLSGLDQGSDFSWYGWPGLSVPAEECQELDSSLKEQHNAVGVALDDDLAGTHYNGFSSIRHKTESAVT